MKKEILEALDYEQRHLMYNCSKGDFDEKFENRLFVRFFSKIQIFISGLWMIKTYEEIMVLIKKYSECSYLKGHALRKAFDFAKTLGEYHEIFREAHGFAWCDKIQDKALVKIKKLLEPELKNARTYVECWRVWKKARGKGNIAREALEKGFYCAVTSGECIGVHDYCEPGSDLSRRAIEKALTLAKTREEFSHAYVNTKMRYDGPELRYILISIEYEYLKKTGELFFK